jgi:hypothetical protein
MPDDISVPLSLRPILSVFLDLRLYVLAKSLRCTVLSQHWEARVNLHAAGSTLAWTPKATILSITVSHIYFLFWKFHWRVTNLYGFN